MPELPEVEITARRLDRGLKGAQVESALAPGMNVMKTFEPPLEALAGRELTAVRRVGKMPIIELGELALLIHLMSAGRLRVHEKRASLKDRASRVLLRLDDGRELRLRELGTKQRAWAKLLPAEAVDEDEAVATLGPEAWPALRFGPTHWGEWIRSPDIETRYVRVFEAARGAIAPAHAEIIAAVCHAARRTHDGMQLHLARAFAAGAQVPQTAEALSYMLLPCGGPALIDAVAAWDDAAKAGACPPPYVD